MSALLEARDLSVSFPVGGGWLQPARQVPAVRGVNLALQAGEALAVVGESGSGKTTLARALLGLVPVSGGQVIFAGQDTATMPATAATSRSASAAAKPPSRTAPSASISGPMAGSPSNRSPVITPHRGR